MNTYKRCVFIIFWANSILAHTVPDSGNEDYTKCGNDNYPLFIHGIDKLVETSDPLVVDLITENLPDFKYELKKAKLSGMKDCTVSTLTINKKKLAFQYNLQCPHLEENAEYNLKGHVINTSVEGEGNLKYICDGCLIMLGGNYEKSIKNDGKEHIKIINYQLVLKTTGDVTIDLSHTFGGDNEKSNAVRKLMNENWKLSGLKPFTDLFIQHLNSFLQLVSVDEGCVGKH